MAKEFVLYDFDNEKPIPFDSIEEVSAYGKKIGFNNPQSDDFATKVVLVEMGTPFEFNGKKFVVWDDEFAGWHQYQASTKKSQSPATFTDMVAKQRAKNNSVKKDGYINDDEENEWLWDLQEFYRILIPKFERTTQKLTTVMGEVIAYDNNGQFSGAEGHEIQDAIDTMRELLDNLEDKINE